MSTDEHQAYLARVRARLVAARDGGAFREAEVSAPAAPPPSPVVPGNAPPVVSAQPSPYSQSERADDHHVELAGLASALATVAERLAEVARALRGQT